jgi:molecular chaperone DnaK (HSP70)
LYRCTYSPPTEKYSFNTITTGGHPFLGGQDVDQLMYAEILKELETNDKSLDFTYELQFRKAIEDERKKFSNKVKVAQNSGLNTEKVSKTLVYLSNLYSLLQLSLFPQTREYINQFGTQKDSKR